jgi:uracil-DNA glycosylase
VNRIPDLPEDWQLALNINPGSGWMSELYRCVADSYGRETVYPEVPHLWKAFELCPFDRVKVVVLGQDPYHGPGQAHGLAFSVPRGVAEPPSLRNIFKEFTSDTGLTPPPSGDLTAWAREGVLLLNTSLTVRAGVAASHADGRWNSLVNRVLEVLNAEGRPLAFWLWGAHAQKRGAVLSNPRHLVLRSAHPSPLGAYRGFWGSKPFSTTAEWFKTQGIDGPDWSAGNPTFDL